MKSRIFFHACMVLLLTNCVDSDVPNAFVPSLSNNFLSATPNTLSFSDLGESKNITINCSNSSWRIVEYPEWITVSPNHGNGNATVTVTALQNLSAKAARTSVFYLESADDDWNYKSYISVSQKMAVASITSVPGIVTFDATGSTKTVEINSNIEWEYSCSATWLTVNRSGDSLLLTASENTTGRFRKTSIQLCGGGVISSIEICQQSGDVECSKNEIVFDQPGGCHSITVKAQTSWNVATSNSWIQVTPESGTAGSTSIMVEVPENSSSSQRIGYVYINVGDTILSQIKITQTGVYLTSDVMSIDFDPQQDNRTISISSNIEWTASTTANWLHLSDSSGNGCNTLTVSVDENATKVSRSSKIEIKSLDGSLVLSIPILQSGYSISPETQLILFPYYGGTKSFGIRSNASWTISSSASWLSFSPQSGSKDVTITNITAQGTDSDEGRTTSFYLRADNVDIENDIVVKQEGKYFRIDNDALNVPAVANTVALSISSTETWHASTSTDWLSLSQNSGSGDANITIYVADNNTTISRTGEIIFVPVDGRQINVVVTQKVKSIDVDIAEIFIDYLGTPEYVNVIADGEFSVSTTSSWIDIRNVTHNGFEISSIENNTTGENRWGNIQISIIGTSISKILKVTQYREFQSMNAVDLGLPSGTLWAVEDVGNDLWSASIYPNGPFFIWGELGGKPKPSNMLCKLDDISGTEYDAALAILGPEWCMPTYRQMKELVDYCTVIDYFDYHVTIKGPNKETLKLRVVDDYYWTSTAAGPVSSDGKSRPVYCLEFSHSSDELRVVTVVAGTGDSNWNAARIRAVKK